MGDLERARSLSCGLSVSVLGRFRGVIDRFLLRIEVRQGEKLRQRDRGFELCERAERRGFGPDEEREGERNVQEDDEGRAR